MSQAMIIAQFAIQYGIPAAQKLIALFAKEAPSNDDWLQVWALCEKPYEAYVAPAGAWTGTPGTPPGAFGNPIR